MQHNIALIFAWTERHFVFQKTFYIMFLNDNKMNFVQWTVHLFLQPNIIAPSTINQYGKIDQNENDKEDWVSYIDTFMLFSEFIVKMQNTYNLIGWNSVYISDIFNCYRANINGMWNAGKLGGIYASLSLH